MISKGVSRFALAMCATLFAGPLGAQGGAITGKVTDATSARPIASAQVQAQTAEGQIVGSVRTREDGDFRIANLAAGTYSLMVRGIGFQPKRVLDIAVAENATVTANVEVTPTATELNPVVTTASRRPEKALDAPASVGVVETRDIQERTAVTVADHVRGLPGVDVVQGGIAQSNVVARGFNNAFSGSLLMLQDYRFAGVPSLRVNVPFLMTGTNEDVERIEVLLGPASALYGPNSANGVMHVITKSPFTSQGTTLTVDGGERSLFRGSLRHAGLIGSKVGYKLSGEYFTASDWRSPSARDAATNEVLPNFDPGEPDVFPAEAPPARRGQPNVRDFDLEKMTGEARLDIRPTTNSEFVTTIGYSKVGSGLELTGANGTAQIKDWTYQSFQQRARVGRLFGQVFMNLSNAGNDDSLDTEGTFLLRSGQPIVDKSRVFAGQLQHGIALGTRQDFVYGVDYIRTDPRTGATINGRNEDGDEVTEYGGYVQSTTNLSHLFQFIAALRVDHNNIIEGYQTSPRLALVFKPTETQNIRFTFNRAFSTPANFSYFLDLIQARNAGGTGYNVRALGNPPKSGWSFNRSCNGLCMKSPATGATNPWVPAVANAAAFPTLVTALGPTLRANLTASLTPVLPGGAAQAAQLAAGIVQFLGTLRPNQAEAGTRLGMFGASPTTSIDPASVTDIAPLEASYNKTYEIGYKGIIGNRLRLAVDGWVQRRGDVGNPAGLATPGVFYSPTVLGGFIGPRLGQFLGSLGLPPAQVQALTAALTPSLAGGLSSVPQGIVQFDNERFASARDFHATYTSNTGQEITVRGVDMAVDFVATDYMTIAGTYSWASDLIFDDVISSNAFPLTLNSPDNKASLTFKFRNEARGLGAELRGRYTNTFPVNSGVYAAAENAQGEPITFLRPGSTTRYYYEQVPVSALLDLGVNYRLPFAGARQALFSINGQNVLNKKVRSFPGTPETGRMIVTRLQYTF